MNGRNGFVLSNCYVFLVLLITAYTITAQLHKNGYV